MSHLVRMGLLYGGVGFTSGIYLPYLPVWLEAHGITATEIALIFAAPQLLRVLVMPLIAHAADRARDRRTVLQWTASGSALAFLAVLPFTTFWPIFALATLMGLLWYSIVPLSDAIALAFARRGFLDYGHARLWGSIAFILANMGGGVLVGALGPPVVYPLLLLPLVALALSAFLVPPQPPADEVESVGAGAVPRGRFLQVLTAAGLVQASHGLFYAFASIHWLRFGYPEAAVGALWAIGVVAEVLVFALGPRIFTRFEPTRLIALGAVGAVLRWLLFPYDFGIVYQLALQSSHGISFALTHLAVMRYISGAAPDRRGAGAQGVYTMLLGTFVGLATLASGPLYAAYDGRAFWASAVIALAGLGVLVLRAPRRRAGVEGPMSRG